MAYNILGNPLTGKKATAVITPITVNGLPANSTNNGPINVVFKTASVDDDGTEAEADTNIFGRLVVTGNAKTSMDVSAYVSQANTTAPFQPGTVFPLTFGDYFTANITGGMSNLVGTFMLSKISQSYDPNEVLNLDMTWSSHGNLTVRTHGILNANGTASAEAPVDNGGLING